MEMSRLVVLALVWAGSRADSADRTDAATADLLPTDAPAESGRPGSKEAEAGGYRIGADGLIEEDSAEELADAAVGDAEPRAPGDGIHDDYAGMWPEEARDAGYEPWKPVLDPVPPHAPVEPDAALEGLVPEDAAGDDPADGNGDGMGASDDGDGGDGNLRRRLQPDGEPRRRLAGVPDDAFQILFFSDLEEEYRYHTTTHANMVIKELMKQGERNLYYDAPFDKVKIDPEVFMHGGDAHDNWKGWKESVYRAFGGSVWTPARELTWRKFFDNKKIMLSNLGNHDWWGEWKGAWKPNGETNRASNEFARWTHESSAKVSGGRYKFEEIKPRRGVGQSYFIGEYKGVQIAMMNQHLGVEAISPEGPLDNPEQVEEFQEKLDKNKVTIFSAHYLLSATHDAGWEHRKAMLPWTYDRGIVKPLHGKRHPSAVHLSGHSHEWLKRRILGDLYDMTVSYPYDNYHKGEPRGYYAVLVSPTHGVLQVKAMGFDDGCWKRGTRCLPGTTCNNYCCWDPALVPEGKDYFEDGYHYQYWHSKVHHACGVEPLWENGRRCAAGSSCNRCKNGHQYWYGKAWTACGKEPEWSDGTVCLAGTSCKRCRNGWEWWYSKGAAACGREGRWYDGTRCFPGTSCKRCKNGYEYWHSKVFHACGREPRWKDGKRCLAGSSCNRCQNGYQYWFKYAWTACGREPCWKSGSWCLLGTSCRRCCHGNHWYSKCK